MKILLCASYLASWPVLAPAAEQWAVAPSFGCGTYLGQGRLSQPQGANILLTMRADSSAPLELILLGGNIQERMDKVGTTSFVEFYVPQPISNNNRPFVFFRKFSKPSPIGANGYKLLKAEACGLKSKFVTPAESEPVKPKFKAK